MHVLDIMALEWQNNEEKFFLDVDFSNDYLQVDTPVGKKHTWQVDRHNIIASKNLESIFNTQYKNESHPAIVPLFNMIGEMFSKEKFPPAELDLGKATLYSEAKLTDIISGVEGNFGNQGWLVSKKLFNILKEFNIGKYQEYKIQVQSKKQILEDYVYLHYYSFADKFVEYQKSKFYKQKGGPLNFDSREIISVESLYDIDSKKNKWNEGLERFDFENRTSIKPKEIFLKDSNLDLFKFKELITIDCFMSVKLVKALHDEKITGFKLSRTTKVKNI